MSIISEQSPHSSPINASVASCYSEYEDKETLKVKNYVKDLLKSRIFLGRYLERRLIDEHVGYRDIVLLSAAETKLKKDLLDAQKKLMSLSSSTGRFGIIDADVLGICPSGICLWTEIENQAFGPIWFQIKSVRFRPGEIMVTLKCLRPISDAYLEVEPILTGGKEMKKSIVIKEIQDNSETLSETLSEVADTVKNAMSIRNVKDFITFLFAFVIAIFTGSTTLVNFLGNFVLALIRELSIFIKNSTPMFLGLLDFCSKIVGGFYILIAMFFKPNNPPPSRRSINYNRHQQHAYSYDDKQFD